MSVNQNILKTPGRASFAGVVEQARSSPWRFKDLASSIMPTNREKAFKHAIINALALLLVLFFMATLYGINVMLMPFFRPLLLALLFGSFLHPMKRSLTLQLKQILKEIYQDDVPIIAGLTMPFKLFDRVTTRWPIQVLKHAKELCYFIKTILHSDLTSAISIGIGAISLTAIGGDSLMKSVIFLNLIALIRDTAQTDICLSDAYLHFLMRSFVMVQLCWLHNQIIYLLLPIVIILKILLYLFRKLCLYLRVKVTENLSLLESSLISQPATIELSSEIDEDNIAKVESTMINENDMDIDSEEEKEKEMSFDGEITTTTTKHPISSSPTSAVTQPKTTKKVASFGRIYKPLAKFFQYLMEQFDGSLDTIASTCVICLMGLIVCIATLFVSFHIYSESAYLIERVSLSANDIINKNPDLKALLPGNFTGVHSLLDGAVKNTYEHGREWIRKSTRQLLSNAALDEFNSTLIERQMVEFWDRAYSLYTNSSSLGGEYHLKDDGTPYDWDRLFNALQSLNFSLCAQIFKQNWDTLVSISDSIVKLLKGNLSLATSLITATLSILIMSGNALLNFIMNLIIFLTTLFYLLSASQEQYIPLKLVKSLLPSDELQKKSRFATFNNQNARGNKFTRQQQLNEDEIFDSVDESINAVFTASLKMMAFHGLSTWLLHRLFELEVVYIPSVVSALFGAVPFIAPYWASVPACFDLWLAGQKTQSILMLLIATIPSSFVTTAYYSEIKNAGHPYLTGLAIAGGVFVFGIEGALFGPMLLVFIRLLYIIGNKYI